MAVTSVTPGADLRSLDVAAMLKEAGATAVVVFALTIGLVAFKTLDVPGGIGIETRFADVAMCMALAFFGRIALVLLREHRPYPVMAVALTFAIILTASLLSGQIFGPAAEAQMKMFLPFKAVIVSWIICVLAWSFAIRAAILMRHQGVSVLRDEREAMMDRVGAAVQRYSRFLGPALLAFAIVFPLLPFVDRRFLDLGILALTYIMLGWGLNIVVGLAGLLDLGYVAFYAVGAYSYALLATHFELSFWICLPFAGIMAAFAGLLLGFPVLRLRGDYLAIVTLGFGEMVRIILLNWYEFTNGPDGIGGIARPSFFGIPFKRNAPEGTETFHQMFGLEYSTLHKFVFLYFVILTLGLITNLFTIRIRKLPVGRAWEALREDEIACRSLGINPRNTKLTAFAIGAMFAGFAGSFFATRQTFISPESFVFLESAIILGIVVLGGFGSQVGVVLATGILIVLPELIRELHQYRMLAFGAVMVLIMLWRPSGLLAHREPTIKLGQGDKRGGEP
ncbi:MAG: high-affinity branched-chain amino acid ABC transporter permease LivM [Alphaproteobacteria bacterium]|jgi:branched-chain amino acid transport system permease protein|nr:high-affinity branched-chain amino acid ABC transporter permease LivM [Alphaproteobacteria bacterium]